MMSLRKKGPVYSRELNFQIDLVPLLLLFFIQWKIWGTIYL
jgi:hypothetical protein